jgi:flagellar basal body-associated protein FliL
MSDPATPAPKDGAKPADAARPKGSPLGVILPVVALVGGVAAGTFVLGPKLAPTRAAVATPAAHPAEGEGKAKKAEDKSTVYRIENVIVNPRGSEGSHFVMATIAIKCEDAKLDETLRSHEDEVRDRVIGVLEKQTLESLAANGARDTLRTRIATALLPLTGSADPSRIYLPQFVIQ